MRAWENVREATLSSSAPSLVYEEGSLIKRAIRDLYNKDIDEVLVSGDEGYREAKDFMRMLMPSHAKAVKAYKEPTPLFAAFGVEAQLDAMFSNQVSLKSGGYLVINPTEALVSIDVNSGRSTREHNIEDTALKTNLEAADEVGAPVASARSRRPDRHRFHRHGREAQQPRGREAPQGCAQKRPCTHPDRADIALRTARNVAPAHAHRCSGEFLRGLPDLWADPASSARRLPSPCMCCARSRKPCSRAPRTISRCAPHFAVAFYILNQKRASLRELEDRFGVEISVIADETLHSTAPFAIDRGEPVTRAQPKARTAAAAEPVTAVSTMEEADAEEAAEDETARDTRPDDDSGEGTGKRRRRRRRRRGRGEKR